MEQAIIDAIKPYIVQIVMTRLIAALPFLGLSLFSGIAGIAVSWLVGVVLTDGQKFLNFEIVDFETQEEQVAYVKAKNQIIAVQGSADPVAIQKAKDAFSAALKPLVSWDNSPGVIQS